MNMDNRNRINISEKIEMFSLDFNHVKSIRRKEEEQRYGPVVGYSYFDYVVRVDVFNSIWVVYIGTHDEHVSHHFAHSFEESYEALQAFIKKNRMRIITGANSKRVS